jgi:hypothetical protein
VSASKAKASSAGDGAPAALASESLDQVRDILVGAQMRAVENRLGQLEERFRRELEELRQSFDARLGELDKQTRQSTSQSGAALRGELQAEARRLDGALDRLGSELRAELGSVAVDLGARKPDSAALAEALREVVRRLEGPPAGNANPRRGDAKSR